MSVIVFPGQGSQFVGMSRDFYDNFDSAKHIFSLIQDTTKIKIKDIIFENSEGFLDITQYTQLAIFCASMSIYRVFKEEIDLDSLNIKYMLGHSLGEYLALTASDTLSLEECSKLLKIRGELMQNAYAVNQSGMVAIIGLNCNSVEKIIVDNDLKVEIANDNSPMQIVISGIKENLIQSEKIFKQNGAKKFVFLNVSAAFHSKIMLKAEKRMKHFIDNSIFKDPRIPIISNYTAVSSKDKLVLSNNLSKQMSNRVKWVESVQFLDKMQEDTIIEIGPGKVLTGLIKRISNKFKVHNIENISDITRFKDEFQFKK